MGYLLFTYPNCQQCAELKEYLGGTNLEGQEFCLTRNEGRLKIREFRSSLKRDGKGGIIIPTLIVQQEGQPVTVLNSRKELEDWLQSKA